MPIRKYHTHEGRTLSQAEWARELGLSSDRVSRRFKAGESISDIVDQPWLRKKQELHGMSRTRTYKSWRSMKARCNNPNATGYEDYGGRGISICDRWLNSFENFYEDMGERPEGMSLDRKDSNGNYEPGNCKWSTPTEQNLNHRPEFTRHYEHDGQNLTVREWAGKLGIGKTTIYKRLRKGQTIAEIYEAFAPSVDI